MKETLTCKATLITRCGCWKHLDVPFPPNPQLLVPLKLKPSGSILSKTLGQPVMEVRYFDLLDYGGDPRRDAWATYEERAGA